MRLAVDASTLVAEALRVRGRALLGHPRLDLVIAAEASSEAAYELQNRVAFLVSKAHVTEMAGSVILRDALAAIAKYVKLTTAAVYGQHLPEARWRVPRDPQDAPTLALALALNCGIWTLDRDFFGCGVQVWVTDTLVRYLESPMAQGE